MGRRAQKTYAQIQTPYGYELMTLGQTVHASELSFSTGDTYNDVGKLLQLYDIMYIIHQVHGLFHSKDSKNIIPSLMTLLTLIYK